MVQQNTVAEMTAQLDRIVMEVVPDSIKVVEWKQPTYDYHGLLCYFKAFESHVNFGFFRGAELDDPDRILEGTGVSMRHVKLKSLQPVNEDALRRMLMAAAKLNQSDKIDT